MRLGMAIAARIPMMATTMSNSIKVKPEFRLLCRMFDPARKKKGGENRPLSLIVGSLFDACLDALGIGDEAST